MNIGLLLHTATRQAPVLWGFSLVAVLGGCASEAGGIDSESHFQCSSDRDCRANAIATVCIEGQCEAGVDQSAGPLVDCSAPWPADAASFETAKQVLPVYAGESLHFSAPRLNRNGTVVVARVEKIRSGGSLDASRRSHLIRWAEATVARLGQPDGDRLAPQAVSCDGMTVVGAGAANYRWTGDSGFTQLRWLDDVENGSYATSVSDDGEVAFGSFPDATRPAALRWTANAAERAIDLPELSIPSPGWSGDGTAFFAFTSNDGPFVQTPGSSPNFLFPELAFNSFVPTVVSHDGKAGAGWKSAAENDILQEYVWVTGSRTELFPLQGQSNLVIINGVSAVSSTGVAVGTDASPEAFIWDRRHGKRPFGEFLADVGVEVPAGTVFLDVTSISADSRVVTGVCGLARSDSEHLFRAVLPANAFD